MGVIPNEMFCIWMSRGQKLSEVSLQVGPSKIIACIFVVEFLNSTLQILLYPMVPVRYNFDLTPLPPMKMQHMWYVIPN